MQLRGPAQLAAAPLGTCRAPVQSYRPSAGRLSTSALPASALDLGPSVTVSTLGRGDDLEENTPSTSGRGQLEGSFIEFPARRTVEQSPRKEQPLVRVRLSVHYRVHSRQMLCIGGSQIPFGWSFLSIAKVPMEWKPGDVWTTEVCLRACSPFLLSFATCHVPILLFWLYNT